MKTIKDFDLKGKTVIIRADLNVPIENGKIMDDFRIKQSIKTIEYAITNGANVVIMSHLGKVKEESDKVKYTLRPVAKRIEELINEKVTFVPFTRGGKLEKAIKENKIVLMENTRFEDLNGKLESNNDYELGKYWASLGDLFINDAFGTSHRAHASNLGISSNIESGIGFLMENELKTINNALKKPKRPFVVILGGAKVSDKIGVIENLVKKADYILIGGGMAFTFIKAFGFSVGSSLVDNDNIEFCKRILDEYSEKIILPIDVIKAKTKNDEGIECFINEIKEDEMGFDIGPRTIKLFKQYLLESKTIIWNGPVGMFEVKQFSNGTRKLCEILSKIDALKIAGGGDTASAINEFGYTSAFSHISTGGGATLVLLEGKKLVGLKAIK